MIILRFRDSVRLNPTMKQKIGRNDPCPCGSGKKYKHCCQSAGSTPAPERPSAPLQKQQAADKNIYFGNSLLQQGHLEQAVDRYRQALLLMPDYAIAHFNLGNALNAQKKLDEAVASYQKAILHKPDFVEAYCNLGTVLHALSRLDEAVQCFQQALRVNSSEPEIHLNLGNTLRKQGKPEQAIECYRQTLLLNPDHAIAFSNLLFTLQNRPDCPPDQVFAEHLRYAQHFEAPLKPFWQAHGNTRDPQRRIKVGYVSGDFRQHAVAYFIEPILACHETTRFEVYGYANNPLRDQTTERIAALMPHWLDCSSLSDAQLAEQVRADGIDILVDLAGHTALNRLLTFARKPAPVQVNYIGYPGSTGLTSIDYRISDPWQDPPGITERYHSETLVRLPGGMAFAPDAASPEVNELPALHSDHFVLACLNELSKVNDAVIALWSRILHALPNARLMLGNVIDDDIRQRLLERFSQNQIGPERLILQPRVPVAEYLARHQQIDLALDPFPYNGGTTTMHSLWMGVPVVTLAGDHAVSRLCAAHLSRVGLDAFITHNEDDYLQCTVSFANDLPALNTVRQSLRQRMTAAACDPAAITRQLEAAYCDMWRTWCAS